MRRRTINLTHGTRRLFAILVAGAFAAVTLSGCINREEANIMAAGTLSGARSFYVVLQPRDTAGLNTLLRDRLRSVGFEAMTGADPRPPRKVDAIVTYIDRWRWDMTPYLLELTVTMTDANTGIPLATGYSLHTSLTRKSKEEMVEEVLDNIFTKLKQSALLRPVFR